MTVRPLVALVAILLAACGAPSGSTASSAASSTPSAATAAGAPLLPEVPVDTTLTPVSRSAPSPEAKAAMDLCLRAGELAAVAGMARLASARDVKNYMLTNGNEPELQADVPVWVIQIKGIWNYRRWDAFNPVCVVKNGVSMMFAPYGEPELPDWTPPPDFVGPRLALPSLAP